MSAPKHEHAHTSWLKDKSFWLAAALPFAFVILHAIGKGLSDGQMMAIVALPTAFMTLSKGKQAYLLKETGTGKDVPTTPEKKK